MWLQILLLLILIKQFEVKLIRKNLIFVNRYKGKNKIPSIFNSQNIKTIPFSEIFLLRYPYIDTNRTWSK